MDRTVKRIVTGVNNIGTSAIISVDILQPTIQLDDWPGFSAVEVWCNQGSPIDLKKGSSPYTQPTFDLPTNVSRFIVTHIPPTKTMLKDLKNANGLSAEEIKKYGFHQTNTLDYALLLSGEVALVLDEEEHKLNAGDCVIQKGAMHTWINHTDAFSVMAFIMIGAKEL